MLRIKEVIKERGFTVKEVAKQLGVTSPALSQNIAGRIGLDRLEKIAEIIGVPVVELFDQPRSDGFTCPHCGGAIRIEKATA